MASSLLSSPSPSASSSSSNSALSSISTTPFSSFSSSCSCSISDSISSSSPSIPTTSFSSSPSSSSRFHHLMCFHFLYTYIFVLSYYYTLPSFLFCLLQSCPVLYHLSYHLLIQQLQILLLNSPFPSLPSSLLSFLLHFPLLSSHLYYPLPRLQSSLPSSSFASLSSPFTTTKLQRYYEIT